MKYLLTLMICFCSLFAESRTLTTASVGGVYYTVGINLSKVLSEKTGINFTALSTAGSGENLDMIAKNESEYSLLHGVFGYMAYNGVIKYKDKEIKNISSITALWPNIEQFVIDKKYASSGNIKDIKNLYKKPFSITQRDSGSRVSGEMLLDVLEIDKTLLDLQYLSFKSSGEALGDKRIAGMNTPGGLPTPSIANLFFMKKEVTILEFSDEDVSKIQSIYGKLWTRYVIPKSIYNTNNDINTISQPNILIVRKDISEDEVYLVTKTFFENLEELKKHNPSLKDFSIKNALEGLTVPLHPGAIKYYREIRMNIPEHLL
jgi:TRAP transporter TAXI family solute receptor